MLKNINHISYVKQYKDFNMSNFYKPYGQTKLFKVTISINSYQSMLARKDIDEVTTGFDKTFHMKILSFLKVFEPKVFDIHFTPITKDLEIYDCKVTLNDKKEIMSLIETLVYEHKVLERLNDINPFFLSHITNRQKKVSLHIPIVELKDISTYALSINSNLEIKNINLIFDFFFKL